MLKTKPGYFRFIVFLTVLTIVGIAVSSSGVFCSSVQAFCEPGNEIALTDTVHTLAPRYLEYSQSALEQAKSSGKILLYFWAPWCSTCSSVDLDIQKDPTLIPPGVSILRIDYDHSPELKKKYHVVTQHTFVQIDAKENVLGMWVGGDAQSLPEHIR